MREWKVDIQRKLTRESFDLLAENRIPLLRIENFATRSECEKLVEEASALGFGDYRDVEPKIGRIGSTVFEYDRLSKAAYFADIEKAIQLRDGMFRRSFDPLRRMIELIETNTGYPAGIAEEPDGSVYYAGLIRRIERGTLLHIDYAPAEQTGWQICQIEQQLSWNLYLKVDDERGGTTTIYRRQWRRGDDDLRQGGYGFHPTVVHRAQRADFRPVVGDAVLFNTRNYHIVAESVGQRVTVTSAIGIMPDKRVLLWS